eukprot:scaffold106_cov246-Pinguiococcus_pyrenoidosus.AAC.7
MPHDLRVLTEEGPDGEDDALQNADDCKGAHRISSAAVTGQMRAVGARFGRGAGALAAGDLLERNLHLAIRVALADQRDEVVDAAFALDERDWGHGRTSWVHNGIRAERACHGVEASHACEDPHRSALARSCRREIRRLTRPRRRRKRTCRSRGLAARGPNRLLCRPPSPRGRTRGWRRTEAARTPSCIPRTARLQRRSVVVHVRVADPVGEAGAAVVGQIRDAQGVVEGAEGNGIRFGSPALRPVVASDFVARRRRPEEDVGVALDHAELVGADHDIARVSARREDYHNARSLVFQGLHKV